MLQPRVKQFAGPGKGERREAYCVCGEPEDFDAMVGCDGPNVRTNEYRDVVQVQVVPLPLRGADRGAEGGEVVLSVLQGTGRAARNRESPNC